jgi:signal transduction histidine kinase
VVIYSELMAANLHDDLSHEAIRYLNYTIEGAKRMQALVTDLLTYTRLAGKEDGAEPVDTGSVLSEVLDMLGPDIRQAGVQVERAKLPSLVAHRGRISQIFQNLLSNAIKYRRNDVLPRISIWAKRQTGEWRFFVEDNGIGIDIAYQRQVFGVFKRLHRSNTPGTGIGLAICRRIVEQYGGHIWVESEGENRGSKFLFTIPDGDGSHAA